MFFDFIPHNNINLSITNRRGVHLNWTGSGGTINNFMIFFRKCMNIS